MKNSLIYIGLATAISFVLLFIVSLFASPLVVELFFLFLVFWCGLFFYKNYPDEVLGKILLFGLFLRSGLALFQRFLGGLPDSAGDAASFEERGWEAALSWIEGNSIFLKGSYYYSDIIASIYYIFERTPLVVQLLNVVLGVALIFIGYRTALTLFESKKGARICAFVVALFPALNLYSALILRETIIVFFFALSFYFFSLWIKKGELKNIILSTTFIFISSIFHGAVFFIGLVYLFVFCFYNSQEKRWRIFSKQLVVGILIATIYSSLFFSFFGSKIPNIPLVVYKKIEASFVNHEIEKEITTIEEEIALKTEEAELFQGIEELSQEEKEELIEEIKQEKQDKQEKIEEKEGEKIEAPEVTEIVSRSSTKRSKGRTAYLEGVETESVFDIVWQTPVRVAYFYLTPFPWEVESWKDVGGVFDISLYILLFFFSVSTLRKLKKEDRALFIAIILIILAFSVVFAWGTSNYGTAFRHRAKIVFLLIVTASYSLSLVNWRRVIKKCQKGLLKN